MSETETAGVTPPQKLGNHELQKRRRMKTATAEELTEIRRRESEYKRKSRAEAEIDEDGWATWAGAQHQLVEQGFQPGDSIIRTIWIAYCSYDALWSRTKSYFVFRDGDHIDEDILKSWPHQAFESHFGEIARGVDAPDSATQLHVIRELAIALGHRDIEQGDTPRSFMQSVWDVWKDRGFPTFNRFGAYLDRCGNNPTIVKAFGEPSQAFDKDTKMEWATSIKLSPVDDRPVDLTKLKSLDSLLIQA